MSANTPADISRLQEITDGDLEFLKELIELYLADSPEQIAALRKAMAERNAESCQVVAHTFRSSSGNVGAMELQQRLLKLENLSKKSALDEAVTIVVGIEEEFDRVRAYLEELSQEISSNPKGGRILNNQAV